MADDGIVMSDTSHAADPHASHHHVEKISVYLQVFAALMVLLVLTYFAAKFDLDHIAGGLNLVVAMTIAIIKALMVVLIFMHVKNSTRLVWAFAGAAFVWLVIMFMLFFADYGTRGWQPGMNPSVTDEYTVRSAVIERHMSDDSITVSPPRN
jgi:cytochrome c oxidase subunit 4